MSETNTDKPSVPFEKLIVVAKEIYDNLQDGPFTAPNYNFDSVNAIAEDLKERVGNKNQISVEFVESVYNASIKGWPCLINFDGEVWMFNSMQNPKATRQDVAKELAKVHKMMRKGKVKFQGPDGQEIKMNRADRRSKARGMRLGH